MTNPHSGILAQGSYTNLEMTDIRVDHRPAPYLKPLRATGDLISQDRHGQHKQTYSTLNF
jgi:hypothetical protein